MSETRRGENIDGAARAATWRPRLENIVIGAWAITPLVALIHFRSIDLIIPVAFAATIALAAICPDVRRALVQRWTLRWRDPATAFACASAAWMLLSVFWAPHIAASGFSAFKSLAIVCGALTVGAVLSLMPQDRIFVPLVRLTFLAVTAAMLGSIGARVFSYIGCCNAAFLTGSQGAAPKIMLFVFPCLGWLIQKQRSRQALLLLLLAVVLVGVSRSGAAGLALIGGVVVIGVGQFLPRLAVMLPALLLLLAFLTAPFLEFLNFILQWPDLAAYLSRFEASIRINIWIFYRDLFWQHPWRGFGFRAERLLDPSLFPTSVTGEAKLHPHHEPLQVLFEFGAIGATLLFGTLFLVTRRLMDNVRPQAVCAAAAVAAYLAAGLVNFSLWESWWLAVASITFVVCNRLWTSGAPA